MYSIVHVFYESLEINKQPENCIGFQPENCRIHIETYIFKTKNNHILTFKKKLHLMNSKIK